jgi:hypothetical protein
MVVDSNLFVTHNKYGIFDLYIFIIFIFFQIHVN